MEEGIFPDGFENRVCYEDLNGYVFLFQKAGNHKSITYLHSNKVHVLDEKMDKDIMASLQGVTKINPYEYLQGLRRATNILESIVKETKSTPPEPPSCPIPYLGVEGAPSRIMPPRPVRKQWLTSEEDRKEQLRKIKEQS